jgi:hypothetical protein
MKIHENVEVHFYEQEMLSVFLESNSTGVNEMLGEVGLLTMFAIRMMSNLGVHELTDHLARMLEVAPQVIGDLANGLEPGGVKLTQYPGQQGRKQFISQLRITDDGLAFNMQVKGFDQFATGVGYYGPIAVVGLMRYLAIRRKDDSEYLARLSTSAAYAGCGQLQRRITISNHGELGLAILAHTCKDLWTKVTD